MPRSNLEIYIDILQAIASKNQLNLSAIMRKSNLNSTAVKEYLSFLLINQLANKITLKKRTVYAITPKGMQLLKTFANISEAFQLEEKI